MPGPDAVRQVEHRLSLLGANRWLSQAQRQRQPGGMLRLGWADRAFIGWLVVRSPVHAAVRAARKGLAGLHAASHGRVGRPIPDGLEGLLSRFPITAPGSTA